MIARRAVWILPAVAALFACAPVLGAEAPTRTELEQTWLHANRVAIARIRDVRKRESAEKTFAATIRRMHASRVVSIPRVDARALAIAELRVPGRYDVRAQNVKPRQKTLWERFWQWVSDLYNRFTKMLFGRVHLGRSGSVALGDLLIGAFAVLVLIVLVRLLALLHVERYARRTAYAELTGPRNAHALYMQASALAAQGQFAAAARMLFLAAVTVLDLRGVVHDDASTTVGEFRRTLRTRGDALVEPFDAVAAAFVAAAYAERPIVAADWQRALDGYRSLTRAEADA